MHAPLLTSLTDTDGDGVSDERRDLLKGLGLAPEDNPNRLHCANGIVPGHDGWLYLALGDRGCDVQRPEGDRLLFQAGGILRCRPDGRDLHVFSRGLRNIYDVALDEELNVFVRDNENDGGDYMIRVCHAFHGSNHGYPYLYAERPGEALPPLADLGRGSSAGGTTYLETVFPTEYRESLFFCEWGRGVVRYQKQRVHSGFAPVKEIDFVTGPPDDPYGFRPTDLVVDRDGSLLISDWCDGQRPKRGRGRIYRITFGAGRQQADAPPIPRNDTPWVELVKHLGSDRYSMRVAAQHAIEKQGPAGVEAIRTAMKAGEIAPLGQLHAVWILAHGERDVAIEELFDLAENHPETRVRAQSLRAIADLFDPVLFSPRLAAGRGDEAVCRRLAHLAENADPRIRLEVFIALARLRWPDAAKWLQAHWKPSDVALEHAAMILLRRSDNGPQVLELLDTRASFGREGDLRRLAIRALAGHADERIVDGLLDRLQQETAPDRQCEYLDLLSRVYKKPAEWTYWGFRPAPRPANTVAWNRTEPIAQALNETLASDPLSKTRTFAARRMLREAVPIQDEALTKWLNRESDADAVAVLLEALSQRSIAETRGRLETIIRSTSHSSQNRLTALDLLARDPEAGTGERMLNLAATVEDGPVLAATLRELGKRTTVDATQVFLERLDSPTAPVRAAAIEGLAQRPTAAMAPRVVECLQDREVRVRRAAAGLAGKLNVRDAIDPLLAAAKDADLPLRAASLESLAMLREPAALPLAVQALEAPETQLAALACLSVLGGPEQLPSLMALAEKSRSMDILMASLRAMKGWQKPLSRQSPDWDKIERAVAMIQSSSGVPMVWRVREDVSPDVATTLIPSASDPSPAVESSLAGWAEQFAEGTDAVLLLSHKEQWTEGFLDLAVTDLFTSERRNVEFLASADGTCRVWLNGREIVDQKKNTDSWSNPQQFDATLAAGTNRLLVQLAANRREARLQIRFRQKSSQAEHERLTKLALEGEGNMERGREVFLNLEKSSCLKCHHFGEQGGRIGPDLTEIGSRFSRIHLVEAILEPSRTVAPSYESFAVALDTGHVVTGVKVAETETVLTLGDNQGRTHPITKSNIEAIKLQSQSTMPDGLEKQLTDREFVDLIGFLLSLKKPASQ